jgi:hypothetical protein
VHKCLFTLLKGSEAIVRDGGIIRKVRACRKNTCAAEGEDGSRASEGDGGIRMGWSGCNRGWSGRRTTNGQRKRKRKNLQTYGIEPAITS